MHHLHPPPLYPISPSDLICRARLGLSMASILSSYPFHAFYSASSIFLISSIRPLPVPSILHPSYPIPPAPGTPAVVPPCFCGRCHSRMAHLPHFPGISVPGVTLAGIPGMALPRFWSRCRPEVAHLPHFPWISGPGVTSRVHLPQFCRVSVASVVRK